MIGLHRCQQSKNGKMYYKLKQQAAMIVGLIRSIIRTSQRIIASWNVWRIVVIFARNIPSSTMAVVRVVLAFLWPTKRAVILSALNTMNDYTKRLLLMVKVQQRAIACLLYTVMRLSTSYRIRRIDAFSLIHLRSIRLSAC